MAVKIKSHHNVGGLPGSSIQVGKPLRKLFKDEVRKVAAPWGSRRRLCAAIRSRARPARTLGEVTDEKLNRLRDADLIVREEIRAGLYHDIRGLPCCCLFVPLA